ncbi:NAD(P)-dependent oxidoreductase [Kitasatospora aureofaciens]|uniref:NAD-dependent epimerase/dehydratase family protein n=1 Tax=Kitasatospora aureofaciens TaxID=1894 RepID=UPI001C486EEF|nr:NAD(P)-dependent oxidoreductase [Kitasatospora aureofaciens]MBV6701751.1 NAD(P)-dependent oxidoreductase [Kitasatospora aureofaciens]
MRIAVTGAAGFCGAHLARAAAEHGLDVRCYGRRPGPVGQHVPWDATAGDPDFTGADLVVHCAAAVADLPPGSPAEAHQHAVNVTGTERVLRAAAGRPVVQVSSASVYDPRLTAPAVTEDHPTAAGQLNAYGRTKAAAEQRALAAGAVVLRPRAVYGPADPHLVPQLLARARHGLLLLPGGDVRLSLTAVANLTDACLAALGLTGAPPWPSGAYNIADATPYRRDEAVRRVLAAHRVRARIGHVPAPLARLAARTGRVPGLTPYAVDLLARGVVLDLARARAQGWRPRHDLTTYRPDA